MKPNKGWIRLSIVALGLIVVGLIIPSLKIYQFSPFNSGVSIIIALLAVLWLVYSILSWVIEGFKN